MSSTYGQQLARDPKRKDRLKYGKTLVLYHQTNPTAAQAIQTSGEFRRGGGGMVGGGIYFATSANATHKKAKSTGVILKVEVMIGSVKTIPKTQIQNFTFTKLAKQGYDSLLVTPLVTGDEYIVYNYDQIIRIAVDGTNNWYPGKYYKKITGSSDKIDSSNKTPCQYGKNCYRTHPDHFKQFSHPSGVKYNIKKKCKYGKECYRQNPQHKKDFWHPS